MVDQPRREIEVRGYADLHTALRERATELKISRNEIDRLAGLVSGHAGKILAPRPLRRMQDETLAFMLLSHNAGNSPRLTLRQKLDVYAKVFHLKSV